MVEARLAGAGARAGERRLDSGPHHVFAARPIDRLIGVNEMKSSKFTTSRSWIRKNSAALLKFCNFSYRFETPCSAG